MGNQQKRTPHSVVDAALAEQDATLRAYLYKRASRDPRKRGTSTADQDTEIRRICEHNGWVIAGEFEDLDRSASRHARRERPDFNTMVEGIVGGGCDVVVAWESSRFQRDLDAYVKLRKICAENNVLWCYNGTVFDMTNGSDRFRSGLDALRDEYESDAIRDRILRTVRLNAERGAPHGPIPFGYRREYDPTTGDLLRQVPDEAAAELVREAARRILAGETTNAIARDFNQRGIPAARGAKQGWDLSSVKAIVLRPSVAGKRVHQGRIVGDATWDPILDEFTYYGCQRILTDPARRTQRDSAVKHLLSNIALCWRCQSTLRYQVNRKVSCYMCPKACCSMAVGKFDDYVEAAVLRRIEKPRFAQSLQKLDGRSGLQESLAVVDELEADLERARQLVGARKLSVESLASIEQQLLPQIAAARRKVECASLPSVLHTVAGPGARDAWADFEVSQRRAVLRAVVRITLNRARTKGIKVIEEGRITLDWLV